MSSMRPSKPSASCCKARRRARRRARAAPFVVAADETKVHRATRPRRGMTGRVSARNVRHLYYIMCALKRCSRRVLPPGSLACMLLTAHRAHCGQGPCAENALCHAYMCGVVHRVVSMGRMKRISGDVLTVPVRFPEGQGSPAHGPGARRAGRRAGGRQETTPTTSVPRGKLGSSLALCLSTTEPLGVPP